MSALICGSLAYDTIMVFNDKFKHHLQPPEGSEEPLDVYFNVPDLRRQFGGSAGNIAYNLKMLGESPLLVATVGHDSAHYEEWLENHGISCNYLYHVEHSFTAQAFISIDIDDNHMTAFHPGAMNFSAYSQLWKAAQESTLGTVSSDSTEGMVTHALQFVEAGVPFIFDPSYATFEFDGDELLKFIEQANWILVNKKEWQYMHQKTGLTAEQVAQRVQALIVTLDAQGSLIYAEDTRYQIPAAKARAINDPTGCGDAFCAGLLYGLLKDIDWETTGRIASLMGAIKVEHHGSQNHTFTLDTFKAKFKKNFGYALIL